MLLGLGLLRCFCKVALEVALEVALASGAPNTLSRSNLHQDTIEKGFRKNALIASIKPFTGFSKQ
jgi:hypothetical protein